MVRIEIIPTVETNNKSNKQSAGLAERGEEVSRKSVSANLDNRLTIFI